jgi:hypothetical protein
MVHLDRTTLLAIAVFGAAVVLVVARALGAPPPPRRPTASALELAGFAQEVAASEREWENVTTQNFPADHWSQRDDFHGREYKQVVEVSRKNDVAIEPILRAIDADVRKQPAKSTDAPDLRNAHAVPCKPRPFYD